MPLWRYFKESRESELIVVMGEDIAALLGLAIALTSVVLAVVTGNPMFDALGSIAVEALRFVQQAPAGRAARPATPRDPAALPGELAERLAGVQDPDLRAALERMAQGVYRKR